VITANSPEKEDDWPDLDVQHHRPSPRRNASDSNRPEGAAPETSTPNNEMRRGDKMPYTIGADGRRIKMRSSRTKLSQYLLASDEQDNKDPDLETSELEPSELDTSDLSTPDQHSNNVSKPDLQEGRAPGVDTPNNRGRRSGNRSSGYYYNGRLETKGMREIRLATSQPSSNPDLGTSDLGTTSPDTPNHPLVPTRIFSNPNRPKPTASDVETPDSQNQRGSGLSMKDSDKSLESEPVGDLRTAPGPKDMNGEAKETSTETPSNDGLALGYTQAQPNEVKDFNTGLAKAGEKKWADNHKR
jgi:hypothetical protein